MLRVGTSAVAAMLVGTLSGCGGWLVDPNPPGYIVVNDTETTISVTDDSGQRMEIPPGGGDRLYAAKCHDDVLVETLKGVVLTTEDDVCDGDKLTVHGRDDVTRD